MEDPRLSYGEEEIEGTGAGGSSPVFLVPESQGQALLSTDKGTGQHQKPVDILKMLTISCPETPHYLQGRSKANIKIRQAAEPSRSDGARPGQGPPQGQENHQHNGAENGHNDQQGNDEFDQGQGAPAGNGNGDPPNGNGGGDDNNENNDEDQSDQEEDEAEEELIEESDDELIPQLIAPEGNVGVPQVFSEGEVLDVRPAEQSDTSSFQGSPPIAEELQRLSAYAEASTTEASGPEQEIEPEIRPPGETTETAETPELAAETASTAEAAAETVQVQSKTSPSGTSSIGVHSTPETSSSSLSTISPPVQLPVRRPDSDLSNRSTSSASFSSNYPESSSHPSVDTTVSLSSSPEQQQQLFRRPSLPLKHKTQHSSSSSSSGTSTGERKFEKSSGSLSLEIDTSVNLGTAEGDKGGQGQKSSDHEQGDAEHEEISPSQEDLFQPKESEGAEKQKSRSEAEDEHSPNESSEFPSSSEVSRLATPHHQSTPLENQTVDKTKKIILTSDSDFTPNNIEADKHRPKDSESSFQCLQLSGERVIPSQPSSQRHLAVPGIPLFLSPSTPSDSSSDEKKQQPYTSGEEVAVEDDNRDQRQSSSEQAHISVTKEDLDLPKWLKEAKKKETLISSNESSSSSSVESPVVSSSSSSSPEKCLQTAPSLPGPAQEFQSTLGSNGKSSENCINKTPDQNGVSKSLKNPSASDHIQEPTRPSDKSEQEKVPFSVNAPDIQSMDIEMSQDLFDPGSSVFRSDTNQKICSQQQESDIMNFESAEETRNDNELDLELQLSQSQGDFSQPFSEEEESAAPQTSFSILRNKITKKDESQVSKDNKEKPELEPKVEVIGPSQKEDVVESEDAVSQSILQEASCEPVALQPNTDIIKSSAESTSNRFHLSLPEGSASLRPSGTLTPPISRKRRHEDSNNDQSDLLCKEPRIETSAELAKEGKTSTGLVFYNRSLTNEQSLKPQPQPTPSIPPTFTDCVSQEESQQTKVILSRIQHLLATQGESQCDGGDLFENNVEPPSSQTIYAKALTVLEGDEQTNKDDSSDHDPFAFPSKNDKAPEAKRRKRTSASERQLPSSKNMSYISAIITI